MKILRKKQSKFISACYNGCWYFVMVVLIKLILCLKWSSRNSKFQFRDWRDRWLQGKRTKFETLQRDDPTSPTLHALLWNIKFFPIRSTILSMERLLHAAPSRLEVSARASKYHLDRTDPDHFSHDVAKSAVANLSHSFCFVCFFPSFFL